MLRFILVLAVFTAVFIPSHACTSALVEASHTLAGKTIMWKNRDTSATDNKVEYIPASSPSEYPYVGLFNASDRKCAQAWIGLNRAGFAVMNTASYNLKDDRVPSSEMDREGYIMAHALKHCRTVADFRQLLDTWPRPMGVEANFAAMDADGQAAYFECNNHSYTVYPLDEAESGAIVRTNYSHSGRKGEGYGQIREQNALHLLAPRLQTRSVEPYLLTDVLSCSFYHSLYGSDKAAGGEAWVIDQDFIPRYTTVATVAISDGIMWVALGYPPVAEVYPVWCEPGGVHPDLRGLCEGGTSLACNRAKARKAEVFNAPDGNRARYVNMRKLNGPSGYLDTFRTQNRRTYDAFHR